MEYLKTLCTAAAFLSLALLFVPERPGLRRASLSLFSLLLLLLLIPKDGSFDPEALLSFAESGDYSVGDAFDATLQEGIAKGVKQDLCERFSLSPDAIRLDSDLTVKDGALTGSYLSVSLGKENFFADATGVLTYLKKTYGVDCEVHFYGD